jgi:exodeoxyribonuclease VII large subunit
MPRPLASPTSYTVSELTEQIKVILEGTFPSVWVAGEISDLSRPKSGHVYFTLKDDRSQIRAVIWSSTANRLRFSLADGQAVLCCGDVQVYAQRGSYQLSVRQIQAQGVGALQLALERLQAKLLAEGLFAAERKRPLPRSPKRIAIVTSPTGAALHDFLHAAAMRRTSAEMIVIPAIVQGPTAAQSIVAGIRAAHQLSPRPDVLVVTRGGGSLEDLWCFNEELVVRALAKSRIPTVSAVGHEVDVTLSDFVADVRALTPTDAASRVLPDASMLVQEQRQLGQRLHQAIRWRIESQMQRLASLEQRPVMQRPLDMVRQRARELDELDARSQRAIQSRLRTEQDQLKQYSATLAALSPLSVLGRGYSVTMCRGQAVMKASEVATGDLLRTRVHSGEIESIVRSIK